MGNIGEPLKKIELVPMPEDEPLREPSPQVQPAEPELVPGPKRELVPA
jgi:hypothetical protein